VAGGHFVEYQNNSPFAHKYPELYEHFNSKQDIDVWIKSPSPSAYNSIVKYNNVNIIYAWFDSLPTERFDFECTKVYQKFLNPVCWFPTSLTINSKIHVNEPSFIVPHIERPREHLFKRHCWCSKFLRKLKYCFKNCFDVSNYKEEFKISDEIFQKQACGICSKSFKR
jgi:hypothetical protein